eukprot:1893996-Prymnesium_polylepis.3
MDSTALVALHQPARAAKLTTATRISHRRYVLATSCSRQIVARSEVFSGTMLLEGADAGGESGSTGLPFYANALTIRLERVRQAASNPNAPPAGTQPNAPRRRNSLARSELEALLERM